MEVGSEEQPAMNKIRQFRVLFTELSFESSSTIGLGPSL
jgi:hypothetical protein